MKALTQRKEMAILPILITGQLVIAVLVGGCGKKDPVAGLNKLPAQAAAKLKLVPDLPLLATRIEPTNPQPSEPFSIVPPPCAQIGLTLTLTRKSPLLSRSAHDPQPGWRMTTICYALKNGRTTFKLTDPRIFADLKDSVLEQPPLVCTTNNGPWSAQIVQERACIGTCSPKNTLTVVGECHHEGAREIRWPRGARLPDHTPGRRWAQHKHTQSMTVASGSD